MSEEPENKKKHVWDKVLMGAVIGGAIGSVMGATVAPKKGSETRKELKKSSKALFTKIKELFNGDQ